MGFDSDSRETLDIIDASFGGVMGLILFPITFFIILFYLPIIIMNILNTFLDGSVWILGLIDVLLSDND